ncbi:hypothetical protein PIB30_113086, partial [Stylosanthes scabra]|nr:hypothetical protein [Stylosanthes scabra]
MCPNMLQKKLKEQRNMEKKKLLVHMMQLRSKQARPQVLLEKHIQPLKIKQQPLITKLRKKSVRHMIQPPRKTH